MRWLMVFASFATIFLSAVDREDQLQIGRDMGFSLLFDGKGCSMPDAKHLPQGVAVHAFSTYELSSVRTNHL